MRPAVWPQKIMSANSGPPLIAAGIAQDRMTAAPTSRHNPKPANHLL